MSDHRSAKPGLPHPFLSLWPTLQGKTKEIHVVLAQIPKFWIAETGPARQLQKRPPLAVRAPCSPAPPQPPHVKASHSHGLRNKKKASKAAPEELFVPVPLTAAFHLQQVGLSTAPSIQDGGGIVRCGTSINISKRSRRHDER